MEHELLFDAFNPQQFLESDSSNDSSTAFFGADSPAESLSQAMSLSSEQLSALFAAPTVGVAPPPLDSAVPITTLPPSFELAAAAPAASTTTAVTATKKHGRTPSADGVSSDGLSSGNEEEEEENDEDDEDREEDAPRKRSSAAAAAKPRKGRRAAAEIIMARVGDLSKLNAAPADCDPAIRRVALTRERLLTITGEEMETRFDELNAQFLLSPSEHKELRRQRRLVKNREYAQQSRNKKKVAVASVDTKLDDLKRKNDELRERARAAELEAASLRSRIDAALGVAHTAGAAGAALIAALVGTAQAAAAPIATAKRRRRGDAPGDDDVHSPTTTAAAAGGTMLMVMLLSFGVFMNGGLFEPAADSAAGAAVMRAAPTTTTTAAAKGAQYTGRALLETCESDAVTPFVDALSPLSNATWTLEMLESLPTV